MDKKLQLQQVDAKIEGENIYTPVKLSTFFSWINLPVVADKQVLGLPTGVRQGTISGHVPLFLALPGKLTIIKELIKQFFLKFDNK